ncbi:MAG: hypothetical protein ABSA76_05870 [Bacteroidales bacterium]
MKKNILTITAVIGLILSGCSKFETNLSFKQSVEKNVAKINDAAATIASSNGYQLITLSGDQAKSETGYADSIKLDLIAGIYDYAPDTLFIPRMSCIPYKLFKKTGTSDKLIINMPQKVIFHPKYLFNFYHADSAYNHNNFTITANDYHNYYTFADLFDYKLAAGFTLKKEDIGSLDLVSKANRFTNRSYSSKFTFPKGYSIDVEFATGDTTTSSFALAEDNSVLLKETNIFIGTEFNRMGERQYLLTIGNVEIKKSTGIDSIQVFLNDVLQKAAAVKIIDSAASTGSIFHHRDLKLTFDDGTTTNLSNLIHPALSTLRSLTDSMNSMYFAKNIVDYIAYDIYYHQYKINFRP